MALPAIFLGVAGTMLVLGLVAMFRSFRAAFAVGGIEDAVPTLPAPDRGALEEEKKSILRAIKDLEYEHEVGKISDDDHARLMSAYRARAKSVLAELERDLGPHLEAAEALVAAHLAGTDAPREPSRAKAKKKKRDRDAAPREGAARAARSSDGDEARTRQDASSDDRSSDAASSDDRSSDAVSSDAVSSDDRSSDAVSSDASSSESDETSDMRACPSCATRNDADAIFCKRCAARLDATPTRDATESDD